jgi:hypothetical protein
MPLKSSQQLSVDPARQGLSLQVAMMPQGNMSLLRAVRVMF